MRYALRQSGRAGLHAAAACLGLAASLLVQLEALAQVRAESAPGRTLEVAVAESRESRGARRGLEAMVEGRRAEAASDLVLADELFRQAWADPESRADAAASLRAMYRENAWLERIDESAVTRNLRALGEGFERYETEHFIVLSDCSREWTDTRAELLERTRAQFFRVAEEMGLPVYPHRSKLLCVFINDHGKYRAFAKEHDGLEARWVAGYYATLTNRVVFYNDESSPAYMAVRDRIGNYEQELRQTRSRAEEATRRKQVDLAKKLHASAEELDRRIQRERSRIGKRATAFSTAKTVHEAIHLLAFNTGMQLSDRDYPFWFSEGLATCFETETAHGDFGPDHDAGLGSRRERYLELARTGRLYRVSDLVGLTDVPGQDADTAEAMYSQSHALFAHLYRTDAPALGRYVRALLDEPTGRLTQERHAELFRDHFGDPDEIGRRLDAAQR